MSTLTSKAAKCMSHQKPMNRLSLRFCTAIQEKMDFQLVVATKHTDLFSIQEAAITR